MNSKNSLPLTIRIEDFNLVAKKPQVLQKLRELTLAPYSGMNHELNHFLRVAGSRKINCKIITAHVRKEIVGWALLSREPSSFIFINTFGSFHPEMGCLFEVFVDEKYRRQGVGSRLLKTARRYTKTQTMCIAPWDEQSEDFYSRHNKNKYKKL